MNWMPGTKIRPDHDDENAIMVTAVFLGPGGRTEHERSRVAEDILAVLGEQDGLLIRELAERTKSPLDVIRHAVPDLRTRGLVHTQWDLVKTGPRVSGHNRSVKFEGGQPGAEGFSGISHMTFLSLDEFVPGWDRVPGHDDDEGRRPVWRLDRDQACARQSQQHDVRSRAMQVRHRAYREPFESATRRVYLMRRVYARRCHQGHYGPAIWKTSTNLSFQAIRLPHVALALYLRLRQ